MILFLKKKQHSRFKKNFDFSTSTGKKINKSEKTFFLLLFDNLRKENATDRATMQQLKIKIEDGR